MTPKQSTKESGPRVMATVHEETLASLQEASKKTGLSVSAIVKRALMGFTEELDEYLKWLDTHKPGTRMRAYGENLLISYGPESLREGIRRLDPTYKFGDERFVESLKKK